MWDLPGKGIEPMFPSWQASSQPLDHQASPREIYLKKLAYMITEADISQGRQSARTCRANGTVPVQRPTRPKPRQSWCFSYLRKQVKANVHPAWWRNPFCSQQGQPFCATLAFSWLDEAQPAQEEQSDLLSLPIRMLLSSRNAQNNIWLNDIWPPDVPVKTTHTTNHQYVCVCIIFQKNYPRHQ